MRKEDADWSGMIKRRFRWRSMRREWGRWYFRTNCFGDTIGTLWVWELP